MLDRLWLHFRKSVPTQPITPIPETFPTIQEPDFSMLNIYQKEWEIIIKTQMHFNDLILRFRGITLTAFITLVGATLTIQKFASLKKADVFLILIIILTLWLTAFIIDFFYYHRMLLGSVTQALKFDKSELFKRYGLFGMTSSISEYVRPSASKLIILLYYFVPSFMVILLFKFLFR